MIIIEISFPSQNSSQGKKIIIQNQLFNNYPDKGFNEKPAITFY